MTPPSLTIRMFGPFQVLVAGEPIPRARTRSVEWVLALLVLRHGRDVDRAWLAGTLWPDSEQSQAMQNLRQALVELRKGLGLEKGRIQSPTRDLLTLDLTDADVDLAVFDGDIRAGTTECLKTAVAVYNGPLLEGCFEEWVAVDRISREQACLQALETLADVAEQRRELSEALVLLRRAEKMDGLRDSVQRGLMRVLAANGDAPAALYGYREYRVLLRDEMNVEPDAETTLLYRQIREQTREQASKTASPIPQRANTPIAPHTPSALPHPLTALIGREQETHEIAGALSRSRLVTLVGGGGIGKTRLAIGVASTVVSDSFQEVAFVALAALTDPTMLPAIVASALEIHEEETSKPENLIKALAVRLSTQSTLLILDNCEHLIDAAAALAQALLERCPDLRILATSRQRLGVTGETAWRVPSLPVPELEQVRKEAHNAVEMTMSYAAVQLFVERATMAHPGFRLNSLEGALDVCRICQQLDGIPLAIELAAARVTSLNLGQLASRLGDRFRLLTGGSRAALPRQQTLRSLIDWSYDLLAEEEQALLCRLSVFSGGWTLEEAGAVCSGGIVEEWEVLDLLTRLTDKSLVVADSLQENVRYSLLETVKQYAQEHLTASEEAAIVKKKHQSVYLALAEEAARHLHGPLQSQWLQRLESEHDNLRVAMVGEEKEANLRIAVALSTFWQVRGYYSEGRARLNAAIGQDRLAEGQTCRHEGLGATAMQGAALLAYAQGDLDAARTLLEESAEIFRSLENQRGMATSLGNLGNIVYRQGNLTFARTVFEECLAIFRGLGDNRGVAISLMSLGNIDIDQGDYPSAQTLHEESLAIQRRLGNVRDIAIELNNLGIISHNLGDYSAARTLHKESLGIKRELGDREGIASSLMNLSNLDKDQGDYQSARLLLEESTAIYREVGDKGGIAASLTNRSHIAIDQNDLVSARTLLQESLEIQRNLGEKGAIADLLEAYAELAAAQDRADSAAQLWGAMERLREEIGQPLSPQNRAAYDRRVDLARQTPCGVDFDVAWAEGRKMPMESAIELAMRDCGP